jgi:hypothetical protein
MNEYIDGFAGECPVCHSNSLDYGHVKDCDGGVCYAWRCEDCGSTGEEVYEINFIHQTVLTRW